jgi:hypothetical protein
MSDQPRPMLPILCGALPVLLLAILYRSLFQYRGDYLGHFLAGFGGTMVVATLLAALVQVATTHGDPPGDSLDPRPWIAAACVVCIGIGAVFEDTLFRLAKFDEVDFCNQSLGAALAALSLMAVCREGRASVGTYGLAALVGVVGLFAGFHYAFR